MAYCDDISNQFIYFTVPKKTIYLYPVPDNREEVHKVKLLEKWVYICFMSRVQILKEFAQTKKKKHIQRLG
jgi:hypothetical protein